MAIKLKPYLLDLSVVGPGMMFGALASRFSRSDTVRVGLPGSRQVIVRPRQSDLHTVRQVFRDREYSVPEHVTARVNEEARRIRDRGLVPVLIDAGANIGAASIWFQEQFPQTSIVAIEPDPENAAIARRNIASLEDVSLIEAAVGAEEGYVCVISTGEAWAVKTERASRGCPVITIDQAVKSVAGGKLLVVKIDIEGFESDLFNSNLDWMDEVISVYIEPHDWMLPGRGTSRGFQKAFGDRDFEIFVQGENLVYLRRQSPDWPRRLGGHRRSRDLRGIERLSGNRASVPDGASASTAPFWRRAPEPLEWPQGDRSAIPYDRPSSRPADSKHSRRRPRRG